MIGWLIYRTEDAENNQSYIKWFIEEAEKQSIHLELVYREKLTVGLHRLEKGGQQTAAPDFVIVRTIEPLLQLQFEQWNIPVFNNFRTAQTCNHKAYTYMEIMKLEIPMMPSIFVDSKAVPETLPFPFPFVLKEAAGRGGSGVHWIDSFFKWEAVLNHGKGKGFIAQSANYVELGKDVRVFVVGKKIIAAVLRSNSHNFRANFKLGGTASLFSLTSEMETMITRIINHFEFGMVGIDFLVTPAGELIFNEIEDVVGSRILSETTDINLLEQYIAFIKQTISQS